MREYTAKEMKLLKANPYTFKVTKNKLYFTVEFKEAFWTVYQAGMAPRKILEDFGYDLEMFGQKQIDSMVQGIKRQVQGGSGFRQGENRERRKRDNLSIPEGAPAESKESLDTTYIPYDGEFAYLSTILDAYTKQVLSYVLSDSLEVDFVLETVRKLIKEHGIELTKETLIHSDQGCHYTSTSFIQLVNDKELRQSMSRKGNCWDNAPQESFFGHMKDEIDVSGCRKYREVKAIIDDWMDYYNNERYQWQLAKLSPNEYYEYITTGVYPLKGIVNEDKEERKFPKTN